MAPSPAVSVLGGAQTDFARCWSREGLGLRDMMADATFAALEAAGLEPADVQTVHVGNFTAELFSQQGQLGGVFASLHPAFAGLPAARHEGACASGSLAVLAAMAELEAGRYDVACVVGVEEMRNVPGAVAAQHLGVAALAGRESPPPDGAAFVWPHQFSLIADAYAERYGLDHAHLHALARQAMDNARRNPLAQARDWRFDPEAFSDDDRLNPIVEGRLRKQDCGRITDGAAALILASERFATAWQRRRASGAGPRARVLGWGHRTAPIALGDKLAASAEGEYLFPHLRATADDARRRASLASVEQVDGLEVHDCFTISAYMQIDHMGVTAPGQSHRAIEQGRLAPGGSLPLNPGGGLLGCGHPVGATGVRMLVDAWRQVTGRAGAAQIPGARRIQTMNIGGSATTTVSFVVGREG
ncbi:MAG: thiolase domain-containing protein [Deltaproteobacteria bacterium]|nr:thiolase domain-containing protein [Deltaproteobacteria bacterium]MCB9786628.1 thiolase domain-containing protein [Deltaproteobacteria bacterium]